MGGVILSGMMLAGCGQPEGEAAKSSGTAVKPSGQARAHGESVAAEEKSKITKPVSTTRPDAVASTTAVTTETNQAESLALAGDQPPAELLAQAQAGEAKAQREVGKFYVDHGQPEEAAAWYQKAAEQGDAEAQRMLAIAYLFGNGVERNMEAAGKWFLKAADQGDAPAQRELGKIYGDQWKYQESNDWYLKAAQQGDAESQRILGLRYTIGQGVTSDRAEAKKWFELAAAQGDAISQRELGKLYGEQWKLDESNRWYLAAAEQGDIRAQHMMGVRYTFGQGVPVDLTEAGRWFLLAAEQGDAQSQFSMGLRWAKGETGQPVNFEEAAKWFALAANQGLDDAQLSLGRRYANGEGVKQDYVEAYKWVWLAQEQGKVRGAGNLLKQITPQLTPEQITEAKAQAKKFVPQPPVPVKAVDK